MGTNDAHTALRENVKKPLLSNGRERESDVGKKTDKVDPFSPVCALSRSLARARRMRDAIPPTFRTIHEKFIVVVAMKTSDGQLSVTSDGFAG